jgi:hypothetical protein
LGRCWLIEPLQTSGYWSFCLTGGTGTAATKNIWTTNKAVTANPAGLL